MSNLERLEENIRDVLVRPHGFLKPFVEFYDAISTDPPTLDEMRDHSRQNNRVIVAMQSVRLAGYREDHRYTPRSYFKPSGIMVAVSVDGIEAVSTAVSEGTDEFGGAHGDYAHTALRKAGIAAVTARLVGFKERRDAMAYPIVDEVLIAHGLMEEEAAPHAIGYRAVEESVISGESPLVIGASGMLATDAIQGALLASSQTQQVLDRDRTRGWVTSEVDEFAGYHSEAAANAVIAMLDGGPGLIRTPASYWELYQAMNLH